MSGAINKSLAEGRDFALLLGTDAADIESVDLIQAARTMVQEHSECVMQPSSDGGFVMIGSRRKLGNCLHGVRWSSGHEQRQTRVRLMRRGLRVSQLRTRLDVDDPVDWRLARRSQLF